MDPGFDLRQIPEEPPYQDKHVGLARLTIDMKLPPLMVSQARHLPLNFSHLLLLI